MHKTLGRMPSYPKIHSSNADLPPQNLGGERKVKLDMVAHTFSPRTQQKQVLKLSLRTGWSTQQVLGQSE